MKKTKVLAVLMLTVVLLASIPGAFVLAGTPANPPHPYYILSGETAPIVDGNPSTFEDEWDQALDFFAEKYRAGNPDKPIESELYLRYECPDPDSDDPGTLYAMVLGTLLADGSHVPVLANKPDDAYIKVRLSGSSSPSDWYKLVDGNSGDDGTPPDFAWIDPSFDGNGDHAKGWEASAPLAEGSYDLNVHTQVWHDGESQTSAVKNKGIHLVIECDPTLITLPSTSFTAQVGASSVTLAWETGTELDNAGFNLYRALLKDGPYTQINEALIAAQGDAVSGASYSFLDAPDYGTFYYKLEDVDYYGVSTLHGPVKVTVARPLRRPLYRPRLPEF